MTLPLATSLHRAEARAALLRYALDLAAASPDERPEPSVLSGLADLCGELEETLQRVRESIDPRAFGDSLTAGSDYEPQPTTGKQQQLSRRRKRN